MAAGVVGDARRRSDKRLHVKGLMGSFIDMVSPYRAGLSRLATAIETGSARFACHMGFARDVVVVFHGEGIDWAGVQAGLVDAGIARSCCRF